MSSPICLARSGYVANVTRWSLRRPSSVIVSNGPLPNKTSTPASPAIAIFLHLLPRDIQLNVRSRVDYDLASRHNRVNVYDLTVPFGLSFSYLFNVAIREARILDCAREAAFDVLGSAAPVAPASHNKPHAHPDPHRASIDRSARTTAARGQHGDTLHTAGSECECHTLRRPHNDVPVALDPDVRVRPPTPTRGSKTRAPVSSEQRRPVHDDASRKKLFTFALREQTVFSDEDHTVFVNNTSLRAASSAATPSDSGTLSVIFHTMPLPISVTGGFMRARRAKSSIWVQLSAKVSMTLTRRILGWRDSLC